MTNLFINYYVSDNEIRKAEYIYSINTNLGNRYIDKVFIFLNDGVCPFEKHSKVVQIFPKKCGVILSKSTLNVQ